VAAQARLRQIEMQLALGKLSRTDAIAALELRAVLWRGDDTEVETLQHTALRLNPRSPLAPRIQEEAAARR
jgi:hypothetical protein